VLQNFSREAGVDNGLQREQTSRQTEEVPRKLVALTNKNKTKWVKFESDWSRNGKAQDGIFAYSRWVSIYCGNWCQVGSTGYQHFALVKWSEFFLEKTEKKHSFRFGFILTPPNSKSWDFILTVCARPNSVSAIDFCKYQIMSDSCISSVKSVHEVFNIQIGVKVLSLQVDLVLPKTEDWGFWTKEFLSFTIQQIQ
jgi:hypothetical protein